MLVGLSPSRNMAGPPKRSRPIMKRPSAVKTIVEAAAAAPGKETRHANKSARNSRFQPTPMQPVRADRPDKRQQEDHERRTPALSRVSAFVGISTDPQEAFEPGRRMIGPDKRRKNVHVHTPCNLP